MRIRWNMNTDTPLPPEEPAGENPPDGAMIDYYLNNNSASTVKLEILNTKGELIRTFTSKDTLYKIPEVNIPLYWIRPQQILAATAGAHRFLWDMKYEPLNVPAAYPMKAIIHNTPPDATAPWVMPGTYKIRLTVDGQMQEQPITITMDPRVKTSTVQWQRQHDLSMICYEGRKKSMNKFPAIYQKFTGLFNILENTEMAPTSQTEKAVKETQAELENLLKK